MVQMISLMILILVSPEPRHRLNRVESERLALATLFVEAGEQYDLDPVLLTTWAFFESTFKTSAVGKLKEVGMFQVHGRINKGICGQAGHDISTLRGQVMCGALLIRKSKDHCGDLTRGLYRFASGKCSGTPRAKRMTNFRLRRLERLKRQYDGKKARK